MRRVRKSQPQKEKSCRAKMMMEERDKSAFDKERVSMQKTLFFRRTKNKQTGSDVEGAELSAVQSKEKVHSVDIVDDDADFGRLCCRI
jgi:hypothetical protein